MVVIKSGKKHKESVDISDSSLKDPRVWEAQKGCRKQVLMTQFLTSNTETKKVNTIRSKLEDVDYLVPRVQV